MSSLMIICRVRANMMPWVSARCPYFCSSSLPCLSSPSGPTCSNLKLPVMRYRLCSLKSLTLATRQIERHESST
ncbi:MAG: hypothetical protein BWZ02_03384 [Lentisphaerae bacterium ADurb.BinA184]|nr:MAG: hypothetical protein BWZ02_03384 [Lentisphaerae bacterium ADurb.BinA184]